MGNVMIKQGLCGHVMFWEGDFMPMIDGRSGRPLDSRKPTGVVRPVLIYELTSSHHVDRVGYGGFYREIRTKRVAETWSDTLGFFQVELPVGRYSVFVQEDSLYYANRFDGYDRILPITVKKDSVSKLQFDITYKASF